MPISIPNHNYNYNNFNYFYSLTPNLSCRSSILYPVATSYPFALRPEDFRKQAVVQVPFFPTQHASQTHDEFNLEKLIEDLTRHLSSKSTRDNYVDYCEGYDWIGEQDVIESSLQDARQRQQLTESLEALLTDIGVEQDAEVIFEQPVVKFFDVNEMKPTLTPLQTEQKEEEDLYFDESIDKQKTVDKQNPPSKSKKMLSKQKRKKLHRQERMLETAERKAKEQQAVNEQQLRGFTLQALEDKKPFSTCLQDLLNLAEDFRKGNLSEDEMSKRHMWKRLNFFHVMCRYISEKAPHLQKFDFPYHQKNQFQPDFYVVPSSYASSKLDHEGYERAHISLLSKIAVQEEDKLFSLRGPLIVLNQQTTLSDFFNLCDIAPQTINAIDAYVECELRDFALQLLKEVKEGACSPIEAANDLARHYGWILVELQDRVREKNSKVPKNHFLGKDFENIVQKIIQDRQKALHYIDGMFAAIIHFRHYVSPHLEKQLEFDRRFTLYEPLN